MLGYIYIYIFIYLFSLLYPHYSVYLQSKVKSANPFEKTAVMRLHSHLKNFAKQHNITLEKNTVNMQLREKRVVTRTFHRIGIVVPYDKKTQLGYRDLAVTDSKYIQEYNLKIKNILNFYYSILFQ